MANFITLSTELTWAKAQGYMPAFSSAARQTGVDRNLLLAVASRESGIGMSLNPLGLGDSGNGIGIMQIDRRYHPQFAATHSGFAFWDNILKGAQILKNELNKYGGNKQYALDAYNAGSGGVTKAVNRGLSPDYYTTGGDYGSDVLGRYHIMQQLSNKNSTDETDTQTNTPVHHHKPEDRAELIILLSTGAALAVGMMTYLIAR
jgi:soluble lytic murein transglycosylase-like protein